MATRKLRVATPAEIPADTAAAHQAQYEPLLHLESIHPHPRNIRHDATADEEIVDSIRSQGLLEPLLVAPHPATEGAYLLIAGHRRRDGLIRAGYTHAPAIVRLDLTDEADQVAAMLVENGQRADLTPIEEAEGYDLLSELGWDVEQIAARSGRSRHLVTARRKLTGLMPKAKTALNAGQITIDDALSVAKLPPFEQTRVEGYLGKTDFKYELRRTQERLQRNADVAARAKKLTNAGVPEAKKPAGVINEYYLEHATHGMVRLGRTYSTDPDMHEGCLEFVMGGTKQYPDLWLVCTDPMRHDEEISEAQRERREAAAAEQAEREQVAREAEERARSQHVARQLRCDALVGAIKRKPLDPTLELLIRLALPRLMEEQLPEYCTIFQDLVGVPAGERWSRYDNPPATWLQQCLERTGADVVKLLAAYFVTIVEATVDQVTDMRGGGYDNPAIDHTIAMAYFDGLTSAGHELNTVDTALLTAVQSSLAAAVEAATQ